MIATYNKQSEIVELLLSNGTDVCYSNFSDYASLCVPPQQIKVGTDRDFGSAKGSALDIAVIEGLPEMTALLLKYKAKIDSIYYLIRSVILRRKNSAVCAPWKDYSTVFQLLFLHNSDLIGRVCCTKPSALFMACAFADLEMVSLLLEHIHPSDLYRTDDSGVSYWASLITLFSSEMKSHEASCYKVVLSFLIEKGLNVDHQDCNGTFALEIASSEANACLVKLLKSGANVNEQNEDGYSSLMRASATGDDSVVSTLLQYHANVDLQDKRGWSALMFAITYGHDDIALLLLEHGAQTNLQDVNGTSALMLSYFTGHVGITKLLLGHGADVNLQNIEGITAIVMSSHSNNAQIEDLLVSHGSMVRRSHD